MKLSSKRPEVTAKKFNTYIEANKPAIKVRDRDHRTGKSKEEQQIKHEYISNVNNK